MDRAAARTYLDARYGPTRELAGLEAAGWDAAVDDALVWLGYLTTDDPDDITEATLTTVLRAAGLLLLWDRLDMVDTSISDPTSSMSWRNAMDKLKAQIAAVSQAARPLVVAGPLLADTEAAYGVRISHSHAVYPVDVC